MTQYIFNISRFNPSLDRKPFFKHYRLEVSEKWSILDCLLRIRETVDPTLSFRSSCKSGICGSCAMQVNGKNRLACETIVETLKKRKITIKPLPSFPLIKDLIVDLTDFFSGISSIMPYIIDNVNNINEHPGQKEHLQTAQQRAELNGLYECIHCGICTSSCPSFWFDGKYVGPAALLKMQRYNKDSRDNGREERLSMVNTPSGVWKCKTIFNCVEACPKELNPTEAIQGIKRDILRRLIADSG